MMRLLLRMAVHCTLLLAAASTHANEAFNFGFVAQPFRHGASDESSLRAILSDAADDNLAFVVVAGIKSAEEPCSDALYERRRQLIDSAQHGVVLTPAASDWSDCRYRDGRSAGVERLNRLRELFYSDEFSFGATRIPLIRQSDSAKFRDFAEHMRWEVGGIMFATLNIPANNNRYLSAAGRNSEFEDRLIASRYWLQRIATYAKRDQLRGIVIFIDGDPFEAPRASGARDGFAEIRKSIQAVAARFPGRVLLIHNGSGPQSNEATIRWKDRLGDLSVGSGWVRVRVSPDLPTLFSVQRPAAAHRRDR